MQRLPKQSHNYFNIPGSLKAPLATFDTVDLGDEDVSPLKTVPLYLSTSPVRSRGQDTQAPRRGNNSSKIGGAQSKGRGGASKAGAEPNCQDPELPDPENPDHDQHLPAAQPEAEGAEDDVATPTNHSPVHEGADKEASPTALDGLEIETTGESSSDPAAPEEDDKEIVEASASLPVPVPIGKISGTWLKHQDSDSSSSSGSGSDSTFTFKPIKGSASASATQDDDDDDDETDNTPQTRRRLILREKSNDYSLNLYPEELDPAQIASPSKRKAFEKRLQRLQVKTSPIVRPRSTTPINVVTLEEYVSSSPDTPASPFQEKLKISLPCSEFSTKSRSPRILGKHVEPKSDSCFVFNEEILFSHTRSALVVNEVGHVPPSPRRVLIPPTLSPSSSPKLSRAASLKPDSTAATQLVYFENQKDAEIFGQPAEQANNDWATFSDPDPSDPGNKAEDQHIALLSGSENRGETEEVLTVNIDSEGPCKPANIQLVLSAASSSTPSPSTPDSDEALRAAASQPQTVIAQDKGQEAPPQVPEPGPRPPPIPPRRRPPPPPPPPPPPDVVPEDDGAEVEVLTTKCDLLVDINMQ